MEVCTFVCNRVNEVMECWSNGVLEKQNTTFITIELFLVIQHANTPILHYSCQYELP